MKSFRTLVWVMVLTATAGSAFAAVNKNELPWSERAANAAMERWPDGRFAPAGARWAWNYELGTLLEGVEAVWLNTADPRYFNYIKSSVDQFVTPDGSIPTFKAEENQLDSILLGRQLLLLYGVTQDPRYCNGCHAALSAACPSAAHSFRRILAQAEISESDVAGRALYGGAILCRICRHLSSS